MTLIFQVTSHYSFAAYNSQLGYLIDIFNNDKYANHYIH